MNETHGIELGCWVTSAQDPATDFPIQNLPFGVFKRRDREEAARVGVAIGDRVLDLSACLREGLLEGAAADAAETCARPALNGLMALGPSYWRALRLHLSRLLRAEAHELQDHPRREEMLLPMRQVDMLLPCEIGDYTDFYASAYHARNVGSMFRPDNPLLPNYKYVPIAYHGRSSSIIVSGTPVRRPIGQVAEEAAGPPSVMPTQLLDYELEVGFFIGPGNPMGRPIGIEQAEAHIFGLCLVNDWSARDIQRWEYQPLGPFLSKNFATTVSPWVVTLEALEPYRISACQRPPGDPLPLPHLSSPRTAQRGGIDLTLEAWLRSSRMEEKGISPVRISCGNLRDLYWTPAQLIAHHTSNGCNLRPGDLVASGTVSGEQEDERGCLLERTWRGQKPIPLPGGEARAFLQDGDEVILRGYCERPGLARIGFGACSGRIEPAEFLDRKKPQRRGR
ncbi:MAG: fumarylacetoacetase [Acidobacteriia bacterium]|nr:fumarylacetoacetase [Terriglobia bacterium]